MFRIVNGFYLVFTFWKQMFCSRYTLVLFQPTRGSHIVTDDCDSILIAKALFYICSKLS